MKKVLLAIILLPILLLVGFFAYVQANQMPSSWRYKMTVEVETPEGIKSGSAVREMGNSTPMIKLHDVGNPADVRGEAVVVDLGERGVLFALISSDSDQEFYDTFRVPSGKGGSTPEGIAYYASLPAGTKNVMDPLSVWGYPKLVTFTDMNDPTSVTLVQEYERCRASSPREEECKKRGAHLISDHMEELFGQGVKLKSITLEITDEPTTWGVVDQFLPPFGPNKGFAEWRKSLRYGDPLAMDRSNFERGNVK